MSSEPQTTMTAIWKPGWYELDQSLQIGDRQKFFFFNETPSWILDGSSADLYFFNQLASSADSQVRYARIEAMLHPEMGPLKQIDTNGLDYIFVPFDEKEFLVNAEETPGQFVDKREQTVSDWTVFVTLSDVSAPVSDVV